MKKSTIIAVAIALVLIAIYAFTQLFYWGPNWKKIMDRCIDYNPEWMGMLDCYGVISVWNPDNSGYLIQNNRQSGWIVAQIDTSDDFVVRGNQLYLIDITPRGVCNNLMPGKFCGNFQVNGETKNYYYDSPEEVPTYIAINTETGDQRFYVKPSDAPTDERAIFEQLSTR